MKIDGGVPSIEQFAALKVSETFALMERLSNEFYQSNSSWASYGRKSGLDPLHHWSRQWEYPFVFDRTERYLRERGEAKVRILDAGSGVTFFPYFLASRFSNASVTCCDYDPKFKGVYATLTHRDADRVRFDVQDIHRMSYEANSFDVIYCVSVLEHSERYEQIIDEFKRVLKPRGLLIVTFDISIDGTAPILPQVAQKLICTLYERFEDLDGIKRLNLSETLSQENILTSKYMQRVDKRSLPWKYPLLSVLKSALIVKRFPKSMIKNLTVCCCSFLK